MRWVLFFWLLGLSTFLQAQNKFWNSLELQAQYGVSFPIGSYAKENYAGIFNYTTSSNPRYLGIQKFQNGYARPGSQMSLGIGFQTSYPLKISLIYQQSQHTLPIEQLGSTIRNGLPQSVEREQFLVHSDYNLKSVLSEVSYVWKKNKWQGNFGLLAGPGRLDYPDYRYFYDPFNFANDNSKEPINGLVAGVVSNLSFELVKGLRIGGKISYQRADFNYRYVLRLIPGGSNYTYFNDEVNYRILNAGLQISYTW